MTVHLMLYPQYRPYCGRFSGGPYYASSMSEERREEYDETEWGTDCTPVEERESNE